ncbi:hypothetical protein [Aliivibrio fischeri]|uniref:hypothetical protein n=1 Tax=Aliivibrio fischeri TaxID=668 RepID=UPI0007C5215D|nr:hypothetical protein [Aliivibrio fischeri]
MTSIAIWLNREEGDSIWAASDSKLTGNQLSTMSENCPKLFSIPVQVHINQMRQLNLKLLHLVFVMLEVLL